MLHDLLFSCIMLSRELLLLSFEWLTTGTKLYWKCVRIKAEPYVSFDVKSKGNCAWKLSNLDPVDQKQSCHRTMWHIWNIISVCFEEASIIWPRKGWCWNETRGTNWTTSLIQQGSHLMQIPDPPRLQKCSSRLFCHWNTEWCRLLKGAI